MQHFSGSSVSLLGCFASRHIDSTTPGFHFAPSFDLSPPFQGYKVVGPRSGQDEGHSLDGPSG